MVPDSPLRGIPAACRGFPAGLPSGLESWILIALLCNSSIVFSSLRHIPFFSLFHVSPLFPFFYFSLPSFPPSSFPQVTGLNPGAGHLNCPSMQQLSCFLFSNLFSLFPFSHLSPPPRLVGWNPGAGHLDCRSMQQLNFFSFPLFPSPCLLSFSSSLSSRQ